MFCCCLLYVARLVTRCWCPYSYRSRVQLYRWKDNTIICINWKTLRNHVRSEEHFHLKYYIKRDL